MKMENGNYRGVDDASLLRLAAVAIHEQKMEEEQMADMKIVLSEQEIEEKWTAIMKGYRKRKFEENIKNCIKKTMAAAAAVFLAASGSLATVMAVSPTIREIVLTDFGAYSTLDVLFAGRRQEMPEGWEGAYYPSYIPEGFHYKETMLSSKINTIVYITDDGKQNLGFSILAPDADVNIDTENMIQSEIRINGHDALLFEKKDKIVSSILINYQDCVIYIVGPISSKEIIKISERISEK